jgi:ABC-type lipoprotein export system ATPase subunit
VTFASDTDNLLVQNSILPVFIPGFGLYRCLAILESAGKEGTGFTVSDIFDWDRQLAQVLLSLVIGASFYCWLLYVLDTALIQRTYRQLSNRVRGIDTKLDDRDDYHNNNNNNAPAALEGAKDLGTDAPGLPEPVSAVPPGFDTPEKRKLLPLYAHDMRKSFPLKGKKGKMFRAVKGVDLGVQKGHLFALLGPNGAGKSSTFKCMGAEEGQRLDSGDCLIMQKSVVTQLSEARKHMGVCAQFDAISHMHTCREQLRLFARLRGVPEDRVESVIDFFVDSLDLRPKSDTKAGKLSGGNKRRLSVALAMIGNPDVVL